MRGVPLSSAAVEPRGLANDRRWMLADESGQFLTQRIYPRMALISANLTETGLRLVAPDAPPLAVPFPADGAERQRVRVFDDEMDAVPVPETRDWVREVLGADAHLVYMPPASHRPVDPRYGAPGDHVSFADGYPLLITTESSLGELNRRLVANGGEGVPMNRFRANVVLTGTEAFAEDTWDRIQIGVVPFRVVKPCGRCVIITTDQKSAERGTEPLATLATFRKRDSKVLFGQNLIPDAEGTIHVGDVVSVRE